MRLPAALLIAVTVAAAFAGCAGKATPEAPVEAAPPAPETRQDTFQADAFVSTVPGCTQGVVCSGGRSYTELYTVPENASMAALRLELGEVSGLDEAVTWKVWCESEEEDVCLRAFAQGHDKLPVTVDVLAEAPPGAQVLLSLLAPRMTPSPLADSLLSLTWGQSRADGTATLVADSGA